MIEGLRSAFRWIEAKVGWNRVGFVLSVTIIAVALFALYRLLHGIDLQEVSAAFKATAVSDVVLAAALVAGGYFTLTFYDLFAVRTIGRPDIPFRVAAMAGFTSYSIGHNVGASIFTGGAVRYRIYSAHGLSAIEVAKVCFVAGLTFWLGNATVLGLGIAYDPAAASAVDQLPIWCNQVISFVALAVLFSYLIWVWQAPRTVGRSNFSLTLPGGPLTLLQILIGIVDLMFCASAMYVLMPDTPSIDFITLGVIFVSATLLGFASHSPGGLGVFDAAMLVALPMFDKEELLASLLVFRLLYYIMPFALSIVLLGLRELWVNFGPGQRTEPKLPLADSTKPGRNEPLPARELRS